MGSDQPKLTRRTALRTTAGFGGLCCLSASVSGSDTIEVPVAYQGDQVMATRQVERDWWDHILESRAIREELSKKLSDSTAIRSVATTESDSKIKGHSKSKLQVNIDENRVPERVDVGTSDVISQLGITIPDEYRGLDTDVTSSPYEKRLCNNDGTFDPIPGGTIMHPNGNDQSWATFCCRVYHDGLQDFMVLITDHSQDLSDDVYQGDNLLGSPTGFRDGNLDYQLITRDDPTRSLSCSIEGNPNNQQLGGHASNLEALRDDNEDIFKTGCTTGYGTAQITSLAGHEVTFNGEGAKGDSGAPWYYIEDFGYPMGERAVLVAMETQGPSDETYDCHPVYNIPGGNTSDGTSAEAIRNDDSDITFAGCGS